MRVYTKIRNDNGVGIVNFATSKNMTVELFHSVICISKLGLLLLGRHTIRLTRLYLTK
jgi:hypothetical protein